MSAEETSRHGDARSAQLVERVASAGAQREAEMATDQRKTRGVVHTPAALARFVTRALDAALVRDLALPGGLADPRVVVLDPSCGPGVFLAAALELISARPSRPRALIGVDIDRAAIGRASALLSAPARRADVCLELCCGETLASLTPHSLVEDPSLVRVVLGNPPWAGRSANRGGECTDRLLRDWRLDADGEPLRERKIGVLSDDYVRFFRWSTELVVRGGAGGALGLVTNGSFLDGPVHRGMRASLAREFDRVDVVDLGGSSLVARSRGARDENVFGVRPCVAITLATRAHHDRGAPGSVRVARLRGSALVKIERLGAAADTDALGLRHIQSAGRGARFVAGAEVPREWSSWPGLDAWMPFHREGLQSNRDALVIDADLEALRARLARFAAGQEGLAKRSAHWNEAVARARARSLDDSAFRRIAYRPLDSQWICVDPALCHRPRPDLMRAIDSSAFAIVTANKDRGEVPWRHAAVVADLPDNCFLSVRSSCRTRVFSTHDEEGRDNVDPARRDALRHLLQRDVDASMIARWALAFLMSAHYRERYGDALRGELPRVPAPRTREEFERGVAVGQAVIAAWLEEPAPDPDARWLPGAVRGRARAEPREGAIVVGGRRVAEGIDPRALDLSVGHHEVLSRWVQAASTRSALSPDALGLGLAVARARAIGGAEVAADAFTRSIRVFQPEAEPGTMRP